MSQKVITEAMVGTTASGGCVAEALLAGLASVRQDVLCSLVDDCVVPRTVAERW